MYYSYDYFLSIFIITIVILFVLPLVSLFLYPYPYCCCFYFPNNMAPLAEQSASTAIAASTWAGCETAAYENALIRNQGNEAFLPGRRGRLKWYMEHIVLHTYLPSDIHSCIDVYMHTYKQTYGSTSRQKHEYMHMHTFVQLKLL